MARAPPAARNFLKFEARHTRAPNPKCVIKRCVGSVSRRRVGSVSRQRVDRPAQVELCSGAAVLPYLLCTPPFDPGIGRRCESW